MAERAIDTATDVSRTITEVSAALQTAVDRLSAAVATARQPGKPLATLSAITREAPLATATPEHESELATLEHMRSKILLQLMREELRLKQMLQPGAATDAAADDLAVPDPPPPRSVQGGE